MKMERRMPRVHGRLLVPPAPVAARGWLALIFGAIALVCLPGCVPNVTYDYSKEPDPRNTDYVVGVSDAIRINVWKNGELSTEATVRPDGTVTMSLIGDIKAAGRTSKELREEIGRRLSAYLKSEETPITVAVTAVNSYRFTVGGNVEHG